MSMLVLAGLGVAIVNSGSEKTGPFKGWGCERKGADKRGMAREQMGQHGGAARGG